MSRGVDTPSPACSDHFRLAAVPIGNDLSKVPEIRAKRASSGFLNFDAARNSAKPQIAHIAAALPKNKAAPNGAPTHSEPAGSLLAARNPRLVSRPAFDAGARLRLTRRRPHSRRLTDRRRAGASVEPCGGLEHKSCQPRRPSCRSKPASAKSPSASSPARARPAPPISTRIDKAASQGVARKKLGCANFAHGFAACAPGDKAALKEGEAPNLAIVTAYNDMLSAHQPYERFPDIIKRGGARGGRDGAGRRRRAGHVRRRHPGRGRHGAVACSRATSSRCRRRSRCRTRCSTRRSISASATRSCRGC